MAKESFSIQSEQRGALPLLRVQGEVDLYTTPSLNEAILAALTDGSRSLALDFSGVGFLDSTGLRVLMTAQQRTGERSGKVYLVAVRPEVRRILVLVGLEKRFCFCEEADLPGV